MSNLLMRCVAAVALFVAALVAAGFTQNFTITVTIAVPIFSCAGFTASGTCGASMIGSGGQNFAVVGTNNGITPCLGVPCGTGTQVNLIPVGGDHTALNLNYTTAVNVQEFTTTFSYVPNGWNLAFVLSNSNNQGSFPAAGGGFSSGAGCEGSFFQGYVSSTPPNNTFALQLDQSGALPAGGPTFTYSSVQYYATQNAPPNAPNPPGQNPCNPNLGGALLVPYVGVNKVSTSPVPLNSPAGQIQTTTGDAFSVTITYDGSNLKITMFDVTAGGTCTPTTSPTCFTNTWTGVNIPAIVGGNTAWVGLAGGTNNPAPASLLINSWSYSN